MTTDSDLRASSYNAIFSRYEGDVVAGGNPQCGDSGGTRFFGLLMGQNQHALIAFDTLFKTLENSHTPVARIIELGTSHGGLSVFLQLYSLSRGARFITYDYYNFVPTYIELFHLLQVDYRQRDVLYDRRTIDEIAGLIAADGLTIVLCDNGNKDLEFMTYARHLKSGDIILAHDYVVDETVFEQEYKNRIWSFCELQEKDVALAIAENGLQPFLQDVFDHAAWISRRKP